METHTDVERELDVIAEPSSTSRTGLIDQVGLRQVLNTANDAAFFAYALVPHEEPEMVARIHERIVDLLARPMQMTPSARRVAAALVVATMPPSPGCAVVSTPASPITNWNVPTFGASS